MNIKKLENNINSFWDSKITPVLIDYIKIPNKSPSFDPDWEKNGHMEKVLNLAMKWAEDNKPKGSTLSYEQTPGKTPIILLSAPTNLTFFGLNSLSLPHSFTTSKNIFGISLNVL